MSLQRSAASCNTANKLNILSGTRLYSSFSQKRFTAPCLWTTHPTPAGQVLPLSSLHAKDSTLGSGKGANHMLAPSLTPSTTNTLWQEEKEILSVTVLAFSRSFFQDRFVLQLLTFNGFYLAYCPDKKEQWKPDATIKLSNLLY